MHLPGNVIGFVWIGLMYVTNVECAYAEITGPFKQGCVTHDAVECATQDGLSIDVAEVLLSPLNTTCWFNDSDKLAHIQRMCLQQGHRSVWVDTLGEQHVRKERSVFGFVKEVFCFFFCSHGHGPPPNTPPSLTCARLEGPSVVIAKPGKETAQVAWTGALASDRDDGKLTVAQIPDSYKSGAEFSEGQYVVNFRAVDSKGLSQECALSFKVTVLACNPPMWPDNGHLVCPNGYILGSQCSVMCKDGHQLDQQFTSITCIRSGSRVDWSEQVSDCTPKQCEKQPTIGNGMLYCSRNIPTFGSTCMVSCNDGFKRKGSPFMTCDNQGVWNDPPSCEDKTGPSFDPETCPNDIQVTIDSSNNTASVDWEIPSGSDNSGSPPIITERHAFVPGQRFTAGTHTISYGIKDLQQNQGVPCMFSVHVQTISCHPPSLNVEGAEHMMYDCPDFYRYGAVCELSCRSGYPLGGEHKIQCLNKGESDPPVLDWYWDDAGLKPFCKETKCPDLIAPTNGALACSLWDYGHMCQLQCQYGFDVPLFQDGMYVCGTSDGQWRPHNKVPDCNTKLDVHHMHLKSDVYYYTGKCNISAENLMQIKNNFVKALNNSNFHEACVNVPECKAEFVNVTCGPVTARRKRDVNLHYLQKRGGDRLAFSVTFDIIIPFENKTGELTDDIYSDNEAKLNKMKELIQTDIEGGIFDYPNNDMHLEGDSFEPGRPELYCPEGTLPRQSTVSCSGCQTGQFLFKESGKCVNCPVGTYQDSPDSIDCKKCPLGRTTTNNGSTNVADCLDVCTAGHFSSNGLGPCAPCDSQSYQPNAAAVTCMPCPSGKRTRRDGATLKASCQEFDLQLEKTKTLKMKAKRNATSLTLSTWLLPRQKNEDLIFFKVSSFLSGKNYLFAIEQDTQNLYINTTGYKIILGPTLSPLKWQHLAITADTSRTTLQVFLNGKSIYRNNSIPATRSDLVNEFDDMYLKGNFQLSSFGLMNRDSTDSEITKWSSSCGATFTSSIISSDDLALSQNTRVIIPSMCDAVDECESSPCGRHECINKQGDFLCVCSGGYTGKRCEIEPDYCVDNACMYGSTCVSGNDNYTCSCSYGYSGDLCERKAVDGGWTLWTEWTMCSKTCGGGNSVRTRKCENPTQEPEGQPCQGIISETKTCNADKCPECSSLLPSYGVTQSCSDTDHLINCTISCQPGLYFIEPPLPYYECGTVTGYKWNHQNDNNPHARLPACSDLEPPLHMAIVLNGQYMSVSCTQSSTDTVMAALQIKLTILDCVKQGICGAKLELKGCTEETGRNRSTTENKLTVAIHLNATVKNSGTEFNITSFLDNGSAPSKGLLKFLKQTTALEKSAQQIYNNSVDFFHVLVDGKPQTVAQGSAGISVEPSVWCPGGSVRLDAFCAECPAGSYADGEEIHLCPKGRYQNQRGQTYCKPCPTGKTTTWTGSLDISECEVGSLAVEYSSVNGEDNTISIVVGVCISVATLVLSGTVIIFMYKYITKRKRLAKQNLFCRNFQEIFTGEKPGVKRYDSFKTSRSRKLSTEDFPVQINGSDSVKTTRGRKLSTEGSPGQINGSDSFKTTRGRESITDNPPVQINESDFLHATSSQA